MTDAGPDDLARGEVLWAPSADAWTSTAAGRFATRHQQRSYGELHRWSVTDIEGFWAAVADDREVIWRTPPQRVLADGDATMPGARWFP
ncbi:MAG TPA: acetyl-coenzyme A synthetase N-terminal domain-containing protein, partial [Acidimicrobiales bacterium]